MPIDKQKALNYTEEVLKALAASGQHDLVREIREAQEEQTPHLIRYLKKFITESPTMLQLKRDIKIVAGEDDPVLLQGETGTGKELLAQALHANRSGAFIPVNCAGLPEHLIESELFGHVKGAFTGANNNRTGMFEAATDGTVFLDEIGELPLMLQSKLLRAIQEKRIKPVGSNEEISINCRVICATNVRLRDQIPKYKFREDLYWRISTLEFVTLPLRERRKDIPLLVKHFDTENVIDHLDMFVSRIDPDRDLKGNVRTIQQMVRRYELLRILPDGSRLI